jgi:hypothetical protein
MKKVLFTIVASIVLASCGGGGGGDTPEPTPTNNAPSIPTLSYPTNNLLCIDNTVAFTWGVSTDADGDAVSYQIQVAKDNAFTQIAQTLTSTTASQTISLDKGVAYYWRVKATDSKNASSSYSSTYQFYTEGTGITNHLPFSPVLVKPTLNTNIQTATTVLEWSASDVDTSDALTYDVYFGTVNPPTTKQGDNISANTLSVNLSSSKSYYWKVVVKDNKGGQTIGQVWNFVTD